MSLNVDDTDTTTPSGMNESFDESGSTLIQPEKQIALDIGMQSNYTVLPALREDVYSISIVGDVNALLSGIPVPHKWQPDPSGSPHTTYQVDQWSDTDGYESTNNSPSGASEHIRNQLFNQFVAADPSSFQTAILTTPNPEMYFSKEDLNLKTENTADMVGLMQKYDDQGGMISTNNLFNEYLSDDGTLGGKHIFDQADGVSRNSVLQGTLFGQVQEALINWFEAANYKDARAAAITPSVASEVDPEQYDILRSWMDRSANVRNRHLAKFSEEATKRLISVEGSETGSLQFTDQNTLMYCCFDAEQVKQIFSTVEATGRIRSYTSGNEVDTLTDTPLLTSPGEIYVQDGVDGGSIPLLEGSNELKTEDNTSIQIPRHLVALRHGEGFAIVVPAKTRLRSGTISEANLVVRLFQSLSGAVTDGFAT